jgi:hypothetical protein
MLKHIAVTNVPSKPWLDIILPNNEHIACPVEKADSYFAVYRNEQIMVFSISEKERDIIDIFAINRHFDGIPIDINGIKFNIVGKLVDSIMLPYRK